MPYTAQTSDKMEKVEALKFGEDLMLKFKQPFLKYESREY